MPIRVRTYGSSGPPVVVLHGGPGAVGYMAPVARGLAGGFRVLEPLQRGSGGEPLTVDRHVRDLHQVLEDRCPKSRPALVGSSWGAMLALAYAAEHPGGVAALVLIGCGTFDPEARAVLRSRIEERMDAAVRDRLKGLEREISDPDERLRIMGELLLPVYSHDLASTDQEIESCDARAHRETWEDMERLQSEGVYPAAFSAIECPVLMLHGSEDPHPGAMIRDSLRPHVPHVEYRQWERCGHYPWLETAVRDEFFAVLGDWLETRLA